MTTLPAIACALLAGFAVRIVLAVAFPVRNRPSKQGEVLTASSFFARIPALAKLSALAERLVPAQREDTDALRLRLAQAGLPLSASLYYGASIVWTITVSVTALLATSLAPNDDPANKLAACLLATVLASCLPRMLLATKARRRKKAVEASLPATLEMLAVSVEAGLTLERALRSVARRRNDVLSKELAKADDDISLFGFTRDQALERMARRCDSEDLALFASSVAISTKAGAPIASILKRQAAIARTRRFQRLEAQANKIPTKMIFPLAFLIMPGVFIVAVSPAAISILNNISEVF